MIPTKSVAQVMFLLLLSPLGPAQSPTTSAPRPLQSASVRDQSQFDGPAELPRIHVKSALSETPAPGRTWLVKEGGNVQEALDKAECGDTVALQAGATFMGRFLLPEKPCDDSHWIIIRTSAPDSSLPAEGSRMTPCYAGVASLPGRPAYACKSTSNALARLLLDVPGNGTVILANGANHYRLLGLEITRQLPGKNIRSLIFLHGAADHIIVDRSWLHGTAQDETGKGIQLGGATYVAVVDSYFSDFHCIAITGACTDAQAIGGGNGELPMGPYKIVDNFLEASGECILFGGAHATVTPADIEIRGNHLFKPLTWKPGNPGFVGAADGHAFVAKNLFELKNAQRVLFENNILENSWGGFTQTGFAVLLTPKNQAGKMGNLCPACRVTDVTIRYIWISHVASCFQIGNGASDKGGFSAGGERYSIHDVVCDDVDGKVYKGFGNFAHLGHRWPPLHDVSLDHITAFTPNAVLNIGNKGSGVPIANVTFTNNILTAGRLQVPSNGGPQSCSFEAHSRVPADIFSQCFSSARILRNAIIGGSGWPKDNFTPKDAAAVRFVNFNNGNGGDYHLRPDSPYRKAGTDGKDLGADIDAIQAATAAVP